MKAKRLTTWACTICMAITGYGQTEWHANPGGNVIGTGEYLGAAAGSTIPLLLKTVANQPIDFSTADLFRARINPQVSYAIGTAPSAPRNGFMLLSGRDNFPQDLRGPFTRLHLVDDVGTNLPIVYAQDIGYRQWMRNPSAGSGQAPSPLPAIATRPTSGRNTTAMTTRTS